jgi:hypothetical protein
MKKSPFLYALEALAVFAAAAMVSPPAGNAGLRDRVRPIERPVGTPGKGGALDPRGIGDPRGGRDPRSNGARENQDARRGTFQDNQQNRRDGAGAGGDDARETFEENQDRRQDTFDDAQETREDGRRELADEAADLADDIRDGDEIFDDDDFRGDGDGLIDGDGWEADDNDLLKAVTIGAMRRSLPRNAQPQTVDGQTYYTDGTNWYQPVESPDGTSYQAVAPPQQ